jgi:hypothetical protein
MPIVLALLLLSALAAPAPVAACDPCALLRAKGPAPRAQLCKVRQPPAQLSR